MRPFTPLRMNEMISDSERYSTVAALVASKPLNVSDSTCWACQVSSATPTTMASDEFFMLFRNSLPSGGMMARNASGRMMVRSTWK
ncbi:hypothetical protein DSECCO2_619100 [anaerobic digester metagenome]